MIIAVQPRGLCYSFILLAILMSPVFCHAKGCPSGTILIGETETEYICLDPRSRPEALPVISPSQFVTDQECDFVRQQLGELEPKRKRLEEQRDKIMSIQGGSLNQIVENAEISRELMQDSSLDAVNLIKAAVDHAQLPKKIGTLLSAIKAALNARAAIDAKDAKRKTQKNIDAANEIKNITLDVKYSADDANAKALKKATNALPKLLKAYQDAVDSGFKGRPLRQFCAVSDDLVAAAAEYWAGLKLARSEAQILDVSVTLWRLRHDRNDLEAAFLQLAGNKDYFDSRIGALDDLQRFYQERLSRCQSSSMP